MDKRDRWIFYKKVADEFRRYFNFSLVDYTDPLYGFDVVAFDNKLGVPDGVSTKDFIQTKYGTEARLLVERLVEMG